MPETVYIRMTGPGLPESKANTTPIKLLSQWQFSLLGDKDIRELLCEYNVSMTHTAEMVGF